jgi:hypothetical protein
MDMGLVRIVIGLIKIHDNVNSLAERIVNRAQGVSASRDDLTGMDESVLLLDDDDGVDDVVLTLGV